MSQRKLKKQRKEIENKVVSEIETGQPNEGIRTIIRKNWIFLVVIVVGTILLYLNGMHGDFVSDDYATIPQNPNVADIKYNIVTVDSRNLVNWSNTLVASIFGVGSPVPFHVYSLLIYVLICGLVFIFGYQLMGRTVAMISTVIFCVHPIHVEAVSWISGKPYTLSTFFILSILILLKALMDTGKRKYLIAMVFCLLMAYKAEGARSLTIFFLVPLLLIYRGTKGVKFDFRKILLFAGILAPIILLLIWSRIMTRVGVVNSGYNSSESIFYNPFFQYPTSIAKYLQLLAVPTDLTLYHTMFVFPVWLNWAITLSYLGAVGYFFFKNKKIFFGLTFIFLASVSSMAPVKVAWLVAERYMFFGSLGFCLLIGLIINYIFEKSQYIAIAIFSLIVVLFSFRTYLRNIDWQTNHNLWVNTCQVSPNSHNAWNNIGDDYDKLGQYENAIKGFTQSTVVKPNYADAFHNRANIFFKTGRLDLARDSYNTALYFSPNLFQTYLSLTQIDLMESKLQLALQHASKAVELEPNNPQPAYVLAIVYAQAGEVDKAKQILTKIVQIYPGYKIAVEALNQLNK